MICRIPTLTIESSTFLFLLVPFLIILSIVLLFPVKQCKLDKEDLSNYAIDQSINFRINSWSE